MALDRTWYNTLVDDDGSNTVGSLIEKSDIDALMDAIDASLAVTGGVTIQTTTSTGTQNNFAATAARHLGLRCNNASLLTITGIAAGTDGDVIDVISVGAGQVDFSHQAGGSTAANRLINAATVGLTSLGAGAGAARYIYDGTTARWRLTAHEQGAWIAVPHSGANFTSDSGTWTVDSGDQIIFRYLLRGRTMTVALETFQTSKSAASADLRVAIPASHSAPLQVYDAGVRADDGAGTWEGAYVTTLGTTMYFRRMAATNWSIRTNAGAVQVTTSFEVS